MGTVFKPIVTRPLPPGAQIVESGAKRTARWRSARGEMRAAPVRETPRGTCIAVESNKYLARYRDGQGVTRTVATGCRDESAARAVLVELMRRAELVRAGIVTPVQDAMADHRRTTIGTHVEAYLACLKAKGTTVKHQETVARLLRAVINGCGFKTLADIRREPVERWLAGPENASRSARTKNSYVNALKWFCNWAVDTDRLVASPVTRIQRLDEDADRRRKPRALTPDELQRLLDAAQRRPLDEALRFNRGWRKGRPGAQLRPKTRAKLVALGRERALIYKTLLLTGLRLAELASIRVCDVVFDGPRSHIALDARHEKNRQGSAQALRDDLCWDLIAWITERGLRDHDRLFAISPNLVKVMNRDLRAAGIPKHDARGWTACIHSLRHTQGTLLSTAGVPPRVVQAALRHASPEFSLRCYVDPQLLDVAGALDVLPTLPLLPNNARESSTRGMMPVSAV